MHREYSRRNWLLNSSAMLGVGFAMNTLIDEAGAAEPSSVEPICYCLNTSTLQGQKLDLIELVEIAAKAGYQAIEPWIRELDEFAKKGGSLKDLGKRIADRGLTVESAIGFAEWIVDEEDRRKKGLEETRRCLEIVQQIGGKRLAAPPVGATNRSDLNLAKAGERYRAILELGEKFGVVPMVELWGFSKALSRLGEVLHVAAESGHPQACVLLDVYHLYKGGSSFAGLRLLGPNTVPVLHFNDYPADPPRMSISDAQRVYPGDGVAPLKNILNDLRKVGCRPVLSLELFNRDYWKLDPLTVARTGLEKMRAAVRASG